MNIFRTTVIRKMSQIHSHKLFLGFLIILTIFCENMNTSKLISVEYEIFGKVQGVYFRKFTQQESKKVGVRGWCTNTDRGTVSGIMEGEESKINHMKNWLKSVGSPSSKIEKADFKNEKLIPKFTFSNFSIKR